MWVKYDKADTTGENSSKLSASPTQGLTWRGALMGSDFDPMQASFYSSYAICILNGGWLQGL